ncbi:glycosyltransferase family 2 protein [Planotetraspora sp. A-T 1434]|uniref:glycosyltransferase family 2 protein n=1 Tax=Planotetraspora sp. A-T 1434 TaxID=2979219 RepID=UPI0021BE9126|nr:glycosyltransferase family 2 protein [Planotetraspora sp. A-T 1434]MCT9931567.1 glycosyltransferase family 2 protein [Planotetraspora sp. A-T 1434]
MNPSVGVVIPTRGDRPGPLAAAVSAVLNQSHSRPPEVVVVVDGPADEAAEPGAAGRAPAVAWPYTTGKRVATGEKRAAMVAEQLADVVAAFRGGVRVMPNQQSPGLPGARNTGIAALSTDLVAFCDDDDVWLPGKLAPQLAALAAEPEAHFASCAIEVEYGSRRVARLAGTDRVTREHLSRSRMMMVHSSTFLFRRGSIWVDESAPSGQNEDWDLALRAAGRHPIVNVDRPLVRVRWGASDYVTKWADRIAGLEWMLARHPELTTDRRGAARIYGQLAFSHAALGHRGEAARWAWRTFAARRGEPRSALALAVAARLVSPSRILQVLNAHGHGI